MAPRDSGKFRKKKRGFSRLLAICKKEGLSKLLEGLKTGDRIAYWGLGGLFLVGVGIVGIKQFQTAPTIEITPAKENRFVSREAAPEAANPRVKVHVVGEVKRPGLYELEANDRVVGAISKAGGSTSNSDLTGVNLAAKLIDGTQVVVPKRGAPRKGVATPPVSENYGSTPESRSVYAPQPLARPLAPRSKSSKAGDSPLPHSISLNTASATDLERLPGVGPSTAQKILDYRREHGGFTSIQELLEVKGIGPKKLAKMESFLRL